eukprot:3999878-Karenia_brevis.AAC.1
MAYITTWRKPVVVGHNCQRLHVVWSEVAASEGEVNLHSLGDGVTLSLGRTIAWAALSIRTPLVKPTTQGVRGCHSVIAVSLLLTCAG